MPESRLPYRLLAPGPVPVPAAARRALSAKVIHHRTPEFEKILVEAWAGLQMVFATRQPVQILAGTGTSAMEAAVANLLSPGDEAVVVVSGKFGERWAEICERYGVRAHRLNLAWGEAADLDQFSKKLAAHPAARAVFTQVCETSTATLHPVREMARATRETGSALFCVDAITACGCLPLPMDEWELDVVVAGSQKAFMIPTGLSFISLSERAWSAQSAARASKFYLDLAAERKANDRRETHFSTPTPLVSALNAVLKRMAEAGMNSVYARCQALAEATRLAGESLGLSVFSKSPSPSVTALVVDNSGQARDWLERERNITVMGGQDQLKGKILRVGHMGDIRDGDMIALFAALAEYQRRAFDSKPMEAVLRRAPALFPEEP